MDVSWPDRLKTNDTILQYMRATTTQTGLRVAAHLVTQVYQMGAEVSDRAIR